MSLRLDFNTITAELLAPMARRGVAFGLCPAIHHFACLPFVGEQGDVTEQGSVVKAAGPLGNHAYIRATRQLGSIKAILTGESMYVLFRFLRFVIFATLQHRQGQQQPPAFVSS